MTERRRKPSTRLLEFVGAFTGSTLVIAPDQVTMLRPDRRGWTRICLSDGRSVLVRGELRTIAARLRGGPFKP